MPPKTNEATKIINFIHRANRTNYNGLEARESDICSFIEREIERISAEKDKQREEAVAEERERCIKVVDDYGKSMRELHNKMIGNAHEDSKMILAFDMHSRLIAIKHITEKMNQSELDQPTV